MDEDVGPQGALGLLFLPLQPQQPQHFPQESPTSTRIDTVVQRLAPWQCVSYGFEQCAVFAHGNVSAGWM